MPKLLTLPSPAGQGPQIRPGSDLSTSFEFMTGAPRKRQAARVVCLDKEKRILLIEAADPGNPNKPDWWEIPGGGIDWNEPTADCARRELYEEAGITDAVIGPLIWTQSVSFTFAGLYFDQDEFIHVAHCEGGKIEPQGLELFEAMAFKSARWWPLDELLESDVYTLPHRLKEFLTPIVNGDLPSEPLDITEPNPPW